ncbi:MAG: RnfABCDGE type electron transport complex subunit D [Magnetococcales bacterium]|nr:RnfABCDGE type electron transport complex subunit D [Magnetococcales bacterium]NGZ25448.1 RnfABCDGE type electron transport complex subunit D [Magnetococcales bacterium]
MSQSNLLFSSSPHTHSGETVPQIMKMVIWALMPAAALSVVIFGWPALLVMVITTLSCVVTEQLFIKIRGTVSPIGDYSAALTGLLLAMTLPPFTPWWVCVVGGVFAIAIGKQVYGGLGHNIFNPALIARVFLLISFPVELTYWPAPNSLFGDHGVTLMQGFTIILQGPAAAGLALDSLTSATPLGQYRMDLGLGKTVQEALAAIQFSYIKATGGDIGGSLGETSVVLLTLGGLYLLRKRVITWHTPFSMLAGCLIPAVIFWQVDPSKYPDPLFHLITGGLIMGAFFMATDMVTSPVTAKGQLIFGFLCGLLTYLIRTWGGYPEGVSFAIVIMNAAVPLIDQYTKPVAYGKSQRKG